MLNFRKGHNQNYSLWRNAEREEKIGQSAKQNGNDRSDKAYDPWTVGRSTRRRLDVLALIPLVAIIALVAMVSAVVWAVNRNETHQARNKLATDALWVEQTLRFQMSVDEDMLARLALEVASGTTAETLDTRARLHIATNPEILSVIWYDGDGNRVRALPGSGALGDDELLRLLASSNIPSTRPTYGSITEDSNVTIGLALPNGEGFVTATTSLRLLLERHIPWWIAEQYGIRISDTAGKDFATRQKLEPAPGNPSHTISFDPPLRGTVLTITPYEAPRAFRSTLMLAAIAALASFAILSLFVLFRNAERRRTAERQLRGETAFRRSMEESLTVGLRARDHEGRILYVNAAFCKLVGWERDELIGLTPPMPYWVPSRIAETELRHQNFNTAGPVSQSFESVFRHRAGHDIDVQVYEAPLIDAGGVHRGWMGSVIDITDQKRAARLAREQDENMAHTGRLVTLGEMASTLAHELNQPLSAIASYAAGMANLLDQSDPDPKLLQTATTKLGHQAGRAGQIIRRIQDLVKKREPRFATTNLKDVITETIGFVAADARERRVSLIADISKVPEIQADRILIEQVLLNLIRNGMEAMAKQRSGDELTVRLYCDDQQAIIEVADQGSGISEDIEGSLFDAFASTKQQGMGMGLKICRSIIELHRGHLSHVPARGGGTVFSISLPLSNGEERETEWAA